MIGSFPNLSDVCQQRRKWFESKVLKTVTNTQDGLDTDSLFSFLNF